MTTPHRDFSMEAAVRLTLAAEPWLSCDDCFEQIDEYVERILAGPAPDMTAMAAHLIGCPACHEEAMSLLLLVASEEGINPGPEPRV